MKRHSTYFKTLFLSLIILLGTSCKKFLAEDPKRLVAITNYYKTESEAVSAVNAIYAYLNSTSSGSTAGVYHSTFWVMAGLASDEMINEEIFSPANDQIGKFTHGPINSSIQEVWTMHYKAITIANIAIARIPGIQMDAALRTRLVNEARFLRGLLYFNLVRVFGKVPLVLQEIEPLTPEAASVDAIYAQIISDLTAAKDLPLSYDVAQGRGRATSGAAKSILAKVYLTLGKWQECATLCKEVINSNQYALWANFADVFKLSSRGGKEAIFSVGFGDANGAIIFWEVGQFNVRLLPPQLAVEGVENSQGWQPPTQNLYNTFDAADQRRAVTFITRARNPNGIFVNFKPHIQKYWDRVAEPKANGSSNDFPVIRYADVLLMLAEASNELGDATEAHKNINIVRKRARFNGTLDLSTVPDYVGLSKEAFRAAVLKERRMEFVAEGHRWFDLVRTKTLETAVPAAKPGTIPAARHYLFPIPQRELDLNPKLVQNTGY
ncbi:MAG: RagB/SusD family nutrient uptake outer membrane protein [Segetibacter sp.]|nr:RagB/SusD family nutrient uptake outer membrane protein [Segetibacter sp.]